MIRALPLLLLLAACAARPAERDRLAGRIAGKPQDCISISSQNVSPQVIDENTILYREGAGRRIWRTGPTGACPALGRTPPVTLINIVWGGRLCRNDRFQVLEPGVSIPSAFCFYQQFTPYDLPPETKERSG